MKQKSLLILVLSMLCNLCCINAQMITNGDMEDWAAIADSNKEYPIGWISRNHLDNNPQANYSMQVNDAYNGDKAILLQNFQPTPTTSLASFISLGDFNPAKPTQRGVAFNHRPVSLNFAYKYFTTKANPTGFYQAKAVIKLTRWDDDSNSSVLVGEAEYSILHKTNTYIFIDLPLVYYEEGEPDSLYLSFNTPSNPEDQVRLTLDAIRLIYSTVSSDEPRDVGEISLYPNPATSFLNIRNPQSIEESQLLIFDALGSLQMQTELINDKQQIDIASLETGFYFYQVRTEDELVKTGKFFKSFD